MIFILSIFAVLTLFTLLLIVFWPTIRRSLKSPGGFKYVHVEKDGTVRELTQDEMDYLKEKFHPNDGGRPYIKTHYEQLTPDGKIWGFLERTQVPNQVVIKAAKD